MDTNGTGTNHPRLFVGSSSEGKRVAEAIQLNLDGDIECALWSQGLFGLGETAVESLDRLARTFDFAALVVTPDDMVDSRGSRRAAPRDNVIFEAGLFMGRLGRNRTFLVCPREHPVELPSDLKGLTVALYNEASGGGLQQALGAASTRIKERITELGGIPLNSTRLAKSPPSHNSPLVPRPRRRASLGTATRLGPKTDMRIVNISVTGALLETPGELSIGRVLDLDLQLDDGTIASVTARVVRVQQPAWGQIGGAGVSFTHVPESTERVLQAFVANELPQA